LGNYNPGIYIRKSWEKMFLERKNLEIKTFEKSPNFIKSLEKNGAGNKVLCFGFLGLFFLKQYIGAANKVSGNKISGKKVLKKINPRKRNT